MANLLVHAQHDPHVHSDSSHSLARLRWGGCPPCLSGCEVNVVAATRDDVKAAPSGGRSVEVEATLSIVSVSLQRRVAERTGATIKGEVVGAADLLPGQDHFALLILNASNAVDMVDP